MGIFSLFGKKDDRQTKAGDKDSSRTKRSTTRQPDGGQKATRPTPSKRDAKAALETALKIDAIESEMSSEFVNLPTGPAPHTKRPVTAKKALPPPQKPAAPVAAAAAPSAAATTRPRTSDTSTTSLLLHGASTVDDMAAPSSEAEAVVEEAAILYANGQPEVVEQMLRAAVDAGLAGSAGQKAWHMLFDLYQFTGRQQAFEQLSIAYANKFETSPPAWIGSIPPQAEPAEPAGATPIVPFSGRLDAGASRQIERVRKLAESQHALRLEFTRIAEVEPAGCSLLLNTLKTLEKSGHELVLVGLAELADKIRATIEVGRRDNTEDAWLLLLEVLRLLNREKEFEETSIDYCVTFEVSPPAFAAPQASVTTASDAPSVPPASEGFAMPALIEGRIDSLILAIAAYSDEHEPAIIDCSQLSRVDFQAAGRLLSGLAPFCGNGKQIEFHHVNHLVAELFNVIGLKDVVRIFPRKS